MFFEMGEAIRVGRIEVRPTTPPTGGLVKTQVFNPPNSNGKVWANVTISDIDGFDGAVIDVGIYIDDIDSKAAWTKLATDQAIALLARVLSDHSGECQK